MGFHSARFQRLAEQFQYCLGYAFPYELELFRALDSLYFDMSAVDPDQIRFVFKKIFEVMRQEQHYKHMIGTVEK